MLRERMAGRVLQVGAFLVALVATALNTFELDRFFVPKELVLHLTATLAGLLLLAMMRALPIPRRDLLLAGWLGLNLLSTLFATNHWLALRALAIATSSALLFWIARTLRVAGKERALLGSLALAVVAVVIAALLQAYGIDTIFFSENRAPGGTLGNRNFVAHVAAFGLPLVLLETLRVRKGFAAAASALGVAVVVGTLVLTRSRAAWLAFAGVIAVEAVAMFAAPALRRERRTWGRIAMAALFCGGGVAAALLIPNTLRWRSDNPYLESVRRVADYEEGSGRGRLVQYGQSLRMAARHPLFGVGPGNWAVVYPEHAARNDPSLNDSEPGMTQNPWPSSDWIAYISERGLVAAVILGLFLLAVAMAAWRELRLAPDADAALLPMAALGTIAGALITGAFDAVLLLAVPSFLVWAALGALSPSVEEPRRLHALVIVAAIVFSAIGAVRSGSQLLAMNAYANGGNLSFAAAVDPGNFRVQMRLARSGSRKGRCAHARAAHALYPNADSARDLAARCK